MSDYERCQATKDDGEQCGTTTNLSDDGLCLWHDPEREEKRRRVQSQGGKTTASQKRTGPRVVDAEGAPPPPETMHDCAQWAAWAAHAVATGKLDARTGGEVSKLLNSFRSALEKAESREELTELREKIEAAARRGELKAVD